MEGSQSTQTANELRAVIARFVRSARRVDELAPRFAAVLGYLDRQGPTTTGELASRQNIRQQSMTTTLSELNDQGFVTRQAHADDGRKVLISITSRGQTALTNDRLHRVCSLEAAIRRALSAAEQRELAKAVRLLQRLADFSSDDEVI